MHISEAIPDEGSITGIVIGHQMGYETPIKDATVLLESNGSTYTATTEENGFFILNDIPAGTYTITITAPDFETYTSTIEFTGTSLDLGTIHQCPACVPCVPGDANGDGKVDLQDIVYGLQVISGIRSQE